MSDKQNQNQSNKQGQESKITKTVKDGDKDFKGSGVEGTKGADDLKDENDRLKAEKEKLMTRNAELETENIELKAKATADEEVNKKAIDTHVKEKAKLVKDNAKLTGEISMLETANDELITNATEEKAEEVKEKSYVTGEDALKLIEERDQKAAKKAAAKKAKEE